MVECIECGELYSDKRAALGFDTCLDCAEEHTQPYTGVMIYTHKTGASIQINTDPNLTKYMINATKLRNKGSNLGENLKVSGKTQGVGRCLIAVQSSNAKGKL